MFSDFLVINLAAFSCELEVTFDEIVVIEFSATSYSHNVVSVYINVSC